VVEQAVIVAGGGGGLLALTVSLTRRGLLSLRYGLGWIIVSGTIVVGAILFGFVKPLSQRLGTTPTGALLGAIGAFLLLLALQLSISLSGLQSAIRDLSEAQALLDARLQQAERGSDQAVAVEQSADPAAEPPTPRDQTN
jgi:hypothetical protein